MAGSILILDNRDISYELEDILSSEGLSVLHPEDISLESVNFSGADIVIADVNLFMCSGTPSDHIIHSINPDVYIVFLDAHAHVSPPSSAFGPSQEKVPYPPAVSSVRQAVHSAFIRRAQGKHGLLIAIMKFTEEFPNVVSEWEFKCYCN